jgi:hypothetical protein
MDWWQGPLRELVGGRKVIVAGGPTAGWTGAVASLREVGAAEVFVVATEGTGVGPLPPDTPSVVVEREHHGSDTMASLRAGLRVLAEPPRQVVDAVEAFDPDRCAVVFGIFLAETPALLGRPLVAHRRPEWVALEDKTRLHELLDRAGVARARSTVVPVAVAEARSPAFDDGAGTVWAADATEGYHGGGSLTRWVTDPDEAAAATAELAAHCSTVRLMPFLDGIATSIHGIVLPDGVVALRPVELVTLRRPGHRLVYAGCATFWDPPEAVRDEMRDAARRVGEQLRADVDFRGAFTVDGVATRDGWLPTELNPRFGAGLSVITRGLAGVPLTLVLDLVVAGRPLPISAADLEAEILRDADAARTGGTWQLHVHTPERVDQRGAVYDGATWRWAGEGEEPDGIAAAGYGYARMEMARDRTPVGPSVGRRAVDFWRFFDEQYGAGVGTLDAPPDVAIRSSGRRPPSTRP